ncbi:MAG TPA: acyl carrier protein [Nevskiaceae bacterium]|nr:acyl carrier protein [Nevskiaceae bacterium]
MTDRTATVEQVVREALKTVRPDVGDIAGHADLAREIGLDSVQVMDMVMEIEDRLDISVPVEILADSRTIDQLAAGIRKLVPGAA